jgi:hypothetical protein
MPHHYLTEKMPKVSSWNSLREPLHFHARKNSARKAEAIGMLLQVDNDLFQCLSRSLALRYFDFKLRRQSAAYPSTAVLNII